MEKTKKPYKTFKEYYADPEFKARHLSYVLEKIQCPDCGKMVSRANMTKHKSSINHAKKKRSKLENLKFIAFDLTNEEREELKKIL